MFGASNTFGGGGFGTPQANQDTNPNTRAQPGSDASTVPDIPIPNSPSDCVSSLQFTPAPNSNLLIATSWSNDVLCWDVTPSGAVPKDQKKHDLPVLDCTWSADGTKVFTAGCDKQVKMWDLASGGFTQIGAHTGPVKCVRSLTHPTAGVIVASGSWDKTVKYWDTRQANPIASVDIGERVYALDAKDNTMVVGTADQPAAPEPGKPQPAPGSRNRKLFVFDITRNPQAPFHSESSPLGYQTRCIAVFPNCGGYLVGSVEGRVAVQNFPQYTQSTGQASYTFKCHRRSIKDGQQIQPNARDSRAPKPDYDEVYAVNVVKFHPAGTFCTCGSDGVYIFWDKDEKARLCKPSEPCGQSITAAAYSSSGELFAYACSNDWSQGHAHHDHTKATNTVYLHKLSQREYTPRPKQRK